MRLAQLIRICDQDTIPLRKKRIALAWHCRGALIAIQQEMQALERLLPHGWAVKRDEMGMHSGKIRLFHI